MAETQKQHGAAITLTSNQKITVNNPVTGDNWNLSAIGKTGGTLKLNGGASGFTNHAGAGYGVSTVFFGNDNRTYIEGYDDGWWVYVNSTWVAANNPRDM